MDQKIDIEALRRVTEAAQRAQRKGREEEQLKRETEEREERARAERIRREREKAAREEQIRDCIAKIPRILESAARKGESSAVVYLSPADNQGIAPEILAYCKAQKGLSAKIEEEKHTETREYSNHEYAHERTETETYYHVVVNW